MCYILTITKKWHLLKKSFNALMFEGNQNSGGQIMNSIYFLWLLMKVLSESFSNKILTKIHIDIYIFIVFPYHIARNWVCVFLFVLIDSCGHRTKRYCESLESASVGDFKSQQLPHLPVVYCLRICLQPKLSKWPSVTPAKLRCFTVSVQVQDLYNTIICSWKNLSL